MSISDEKPRMAECMDSQATCAVELEGVAQQLRDASRRAESLVAAHPAAELEAQPSPGAWSASECLAHLAAANYSYLNAMRSAVKPALLLGSDQGAVAIRPGWATRLFLRHLEPPVRLRTPNPPAIAPKRVPIKVALRDFLASQDAALELLKECRRLDLNRIRFANPFVPLLRFSVGGGFLILAAHDRRHLWQAEGRPGNGTITEE